MKSSLVLICMLTVGTIQLPAQGQKAYWVVEGNARSGGFSIVRVYDAEHHRLLHEETLKRKVDISCSKCRRRLDRIVRDAVQRHPSRRQPSS